MDIPAPRARRRSDALTRERIVEAAVAILDTEGPDAAVLTLRALMARLSTGSGAIYHHVANMDELRGAAADDVMRQALDDVVGEGDPAEALRAIAVGIFDSLSAHDWLGVQLSRDPAQPAVLRMWKAIGAQLHHLRISGMASADAGSTLTSYILGSAVQRAGRSPRARSEAERAAYLSTLANELRTTEPDTLVDEIAEQLVEHDDQAQFIAGIDIILRGITS